MNRQRLIGILALVALLIAAMATRGFGLLGRGDNGALTLYGNVDIREVDLGFRNGGRVAEIMVEEGQRVAAGQLLAQLDTATTDARLAQADAQIAQAQAQLARARSGNRAEDIRQAEARVAAAQALATNSARDRARRAPLVESGAISRDVWDQTVADDARAQAQLREAQAALALLRAGTRIEDVNAAQAQLRAAQASRAGSAVDLADTRLVARSAGVVVTRTTEPGAIVQPGATVLTVAIDRPMRVRAYVAEPDLSRINPGMAVEVSADGNPKIYRGTIGYISPRSEFTPRSVETENLRTDLVYRLRIVVADPDDGLRQGQPVTIRIPSARPGKE